MRNDDLKCLFFGGEGYYSEDLIILQGLVEIACLTECMNEW